MVNKKETLPVTESKDDGIMSLRVEPRMLPCVLTLEEINLAGIELAELTQEIEAVEQDHKSKREDMKDEMRVLEKKLVRLANRIVRGIEEREVRVKVELHPSGQVSETRQDTGEVLALRDATESELQMAFPSNEPD